MKKRPIICVGAAVWDSIFKVDELPDGGGKILPKDAVQLASGMATAAAITIARLGGLVHFWGRIGDDANGDMYLKGLAHEGVDASCVRRVSGGRTAFSSILVDPLGERLVVPFYDPNLDASVDWLPLDRVSQASAVLCDMRWHRGSERLLQAARAQGVVSVLDADVAPVDDLRRLIPLADHILLSQPALESLSAAPGVEAKLLAMAQSVGAEVVGVTLGERGALIFERSSGAVYQVPGFNVTAVDTLNAGDAWHGAYTFGLAQGWDLLTRVQLANLAAAIKCEKFGGWRGAPTFDDLYIRATQEGVALRVFQ